MDIFEAVQQLNEVRKEENIYFQGAFWIKGDTLENIKNGNFNLLIGSKIPTNYYGDYLIDQPSKKQLTHPYLWNKIKDGHEWDYYPRGRVAIDQGSAYIHLNSKCVTDKLLDAIEREYQLKGLRIIPDYNNEYQGSHYDFKLMGE